MDEKIQLAGGAPVPADGSHRELTAGGQQKGYVVLTEDERKKGFVRPVRAAYVHAGLEPAMDGIVLIRPGKSEAPGGWACGTRTTMSREIAETYARDPSFYSGTFCCGCGKHLLLEEFVWEGTTERVGS